MKKVLGVILAVLSYVAFGAFLVWESVVIDGYSLEVSILAFLVMSLIAFLMGAWVYFILWLLDL